MKKATKGKNKGKQQLMLNRKGAASSRKPSSQKIETENTSTEDDTHIRIQAIAKDKNTSKPVHAEITITEMGTEKLLPARAEGDKWQVLVDKNKKYE